MMETPSVRRPSRATTPHYRAVVTLTYPATEAEAKARRDGQRDHEWAKSRPGDLVPDWVVKMSPGIVSKGRVELIQDEREED